MPHPFGGALARARQQQARLVIGGAAAAAAAAAPPQGDDHIFGLRSSDALHASTHGSGTANTNASAVAAAHLLRAALEAMKGEMGAMEGRIVQRMEVRWGKQRIRGYAGVRLPGLCQEAGRRTDVGAG